jgi:pyruvate dehydrogenase E1 component alpha subunit
MPKHIIDLPYQVAHLSILDAEGHVDKDLEPDLPDELLLRLHRTMLLGRRFDERMLSLQRQGRIGTFAPIKGQEAAQVPAVALLRDSDWMVPCFRETAAELWRGQTMDSVLLAYGGYYQGNRVPQDTHALPIAIPVGSQIPHAVGLAYAIKYRRKDDVVMVFFGDGATSEGDFHEALNFASVFQTPVVFVCQNNQWAISLPRAQQTHSKTIAQKGLAYDIPAIQVDGNDVLAVYVATQEAVKRARTGGGPTLIECVTYRLAMHTTADDPTRYRDAQEVTAWEQRDPLTRFQKYLMGKGLLADDALHTLEDEIKAEIQQAVEQAEQQMAALASDALSLFEYLYAEMPPYLQEQRRELEVELADSQIGKEAHHG